MSGLWLSQSMKGKIFPHLRQLPLKIENFIRQKVDPLSLTHMSKRSLISFPVTDRINFWKFEEQISWDDFSLARACWYNLFIAWNVVRWRSDFGRDWEIANLDEIGGFWSKLGFVFKLWLYMRDSKLDRNLRVSVEIGVLALIDRLGIWPKLRVLAEIERSGIWLELRIFGRNHL